MALVDLLMLTVMTVVPGAWTVSVGAGIAVLVIKVLMALALAKGCVSTTEVVKTAI